MLNLQKISKYYYADKSVSLALRKVDLEFNLGEFIAITGESGSGKSTLLNVVSGLDTYEEGKLFVNNEDISHYTISELEDYRRQYVGFVFQNYNIIESYTVLQNVEMALIVQGFDKSSRRKRSLELIEQVGLTKIKNRKASKLSGGEKQRTVIARALAKDCPIIVCDEPTGNLDTNSSKVIFDLLKKISETKLVVIVTHDSETIRNYATRLIRLYDGEVVQDEILTKPNSATLELVKPYKVKLIDCLKISLTSILSVPKKSFFSVMIILLMISAFIFMYGSGLKQIYTSNISETLYFDNADDSRLIVTKSDSSAFSEGELMELSEIDYVKGVLDYDIVLDTLLVSKIHNYEYDFDEFIDFSVHPTLSLQKFDLIEGRFPKYTDEVIIGQNEYYQVGDIISLSNSLNIKKIEGIETDEFTFTVVGITDEVNNDRLHNEIYLDLSILGDMSATAFKGYTQVLLDINNQRRYMMVNDIRIDDNLKDDEVLAYDMMFYDIIRDFNYYVPKPGDIEVLVIDHEFLLGFLNGDYEFSLVRVSPFENDPKPYSIQLKSEPYKPHPFGAAIYMNSNTFEKVLKDDIYQPSLIVNDMYEAKKIKSELENMGYNVLYPNGSIADYSYATFISLALFSMTFIVTIIVNYFVGYFVLKNVLISKKKDYLVYRSIGTNKKTISTIITFELIYLSIFSFIIAIISLMINERYRSLIPHLLKYFTTRDYLFILITVFILMLLIAKRFNKVIFEKSVISSLKSE
ncbi:ABC transporter ATP-binding protein [Mycoplasmatota bacterium WC44]